MRYIATVHTTPTADVISFIQLEENKRPRGRDDLLGNLPDRNKSGLNAYQACSYQVNSYVAEVSRVILSKFLKYTEFTSG